MKKKLIYSEVVIIAAILLIGWQIEKKGIKQPKENNIPLPGTTLAFKEDLSISCEGWNPGCLAVDENGNIYVADQPNLTIYVFDSNGKEINKKSFQKGQGPGDFGFMNIAISSNNELYVYDKTKKRLTVFDKAWKILETKIIKDKVYYFKLNSHDDLVYWKRQHALKKNHINTKCLLTKYSKKNNKSFFYYEYSIPIAIHKPPVFYFDIYSPYGIFKLDKNNNIYCALSDEYKISVFSSKGKLIRSIEKKSKQRRVSENDIRDLTSSIAEGVSSVGETKFNIPDLMPALADFFILDSDYLLTVTYENPMDSSTLKGDLFDNNGKYISSIEVPKYHLWYNWLNLFPKSAIYKKGFFYARIEIAENEFALKRYRLEWK